jgi:hypothetical protein
MTKHTQNPHFIGISALREKLRVYARCNKRFSKLASPEIASRMWRRRKARDLHTKLSGVTVIFFPL